MKVVLIGDSIRMGYEPLVVKKCEEHDVWGPTENCGHSFWSLDHFQPWVADQNPDIVHVNFGIHDAWIQPDGQHRILLAQYRLCLERFITGVQQLGNTRMIWASTTPLYTPDQSKPKAEWKVRAEAEIEKYNAAALEIAHRRGVTVNDLHEVIVRNDFARCLSDDGCHMSEFGYEVLSDAVVKAIRALADP
ncbi:MAG: hypothetical protein J7M08_08760 [Planctomycetes bacterium]|nr:hypothetical protein [Planctomycetota bacterium]